MKMVPLGEVASINPRQGKLSGNETVSFVGMAQLNAVAAQATPRESVKFSERATGYTIFENGDLLAARITPCWENGKIGQASIDNKFGVGSTEFHVVRPAPVLDTRYALHFLRQSQVRKTGTLRMTGSGGQRRVPAKFLTDLQIPLPPLAEQRRIAAILDKADAIRQKHRQAITHLDTLTQSIFQTMFGRRLAEDSSITIGDVAQLQGGKSLSSIDDSAATRNRVLKISSVTSGSFKPWESKPVPDDYSPSPSHFAHKGDLLISRANTSELVGASALIDLEPQGLLLPDKIWRFDWLLETQPEYFLHLLRTKTIRRRISNLATGSGGSMKNISKPKLLSVQIPQIGASEQREYAKHVIKVNVLRTKFDESNADQIFESLQSRAFRGEL